MHAHQPTRVLLVRSATAAESLQSGWGPAAAGSCWSIRRRSGGARPSRTLSGGVTDRPRSARGSVSSSRFHHAVSASRATSTWSHRFGHLGGDHRPQVASGRLHGRALGRSGRRTGRTNGRSWHACFSFFLWGQSFRARPLSRVLPATTSAKAAQGGLIAHSSLGHGRTASSWPAWRQRSPRSPCSHCSR